MMNKKAYTRPQTVLVAVLHEQHLMEASLDVKGGETGRQFARRRRGRNSGWEDDWEDEEDF